MDGRTTAHRGSWIIAFVSTCVLTGCSTMRLADMGAHELPRALRAEKPKGIRSIDLAMLGRPEIADEHIEPGDILEVNVSDLLQENQNYAVAARVGPDGSLSLPLVGSVNVRDLTVPQSERAIFVSYSGKGFLRNPRIIVSTKERRPNRVYVIGGVKSPGAYELPRSESDLLAAIIASGGLTEDAGTMIEIRRRPQAGTLDPAGPQIDPPVVQTATKGPTPDVAIRTLRYDLATDEGKQSIAQGVTVQNGDIIVVQQRKQPPIYVLGSVHSPGVYQLPHDRELRVLEAIGAAGGVNASTTPNKALVVRHHPDGKSVTVVKIDLDQAKKDLEENLILKPGDTVSVEETTASFMRGLVRNAFRVGVGVGAQYNALGQPGAAAF